MSKLEGGGSAADACKMGNGRKRSSLPHSTPSYISMLCLWGWGVQRYTTECCFQIAFALVGETKCRWGKYVGSSLSVQGKRGSNDSTGGSRWSDRGGK